MKENLVDLYEKLTDEEKRYILIAMEGGKKVPERFNVGMIPFFDTSVVILMVLSYLSNFSDRRDLLDKLVEYHLGDEVEVLDCSFNFGYTIDIVCRMKPGTNEEKFFRELPKLYDKLHFWLSYGITYEGRNSS